MGIMLSKSDGLSRPCSITFNKKVFTIMHL